MINYLRLIGFIIMFSNLFLGAYFSYFVSISFKNKDYINLIIFIINTFAIVVIVYFYEILSTDV